MLSATKPFIINDMSDYIELKKRGWIIQYIDWQGIPSRAIYPVERKKDFLEMLDILIAKGRATKVYFVQQIPIKSITKELYGNKVGRRENEN